MDFLIKEYVNKLTEDNIKTFANSKGINPSIEEIHIMYLYVKNYWQVFYKGDPRELFKELKEKLSTQTYNMVVELFNEYKSKM